MQNGSVLPTIVTMRTKNFQKIHSKLQPGQVYRREAFLGLSKAADRDLLSLVNQGLLEKVGAGLYYKPKKSRFGTLPPQDKALVKTFLKDSRFLIFSWNEYNSLGLGLTQLYNRLVVYNHKRHGLFELGGKQFDFQRPARGFPTKLSPEFLLVDLLNNLNNLSEDPEAVRLSFKSNLHRFNRKKLDTFSKRYGKINAKRFFSDLDSR